MRLIGFLMVFVGCDLGPPVTPPADSTVDTDGTEPMLGLVVSWNADPRLPGSVTDKIAVESATFRLDYLQVLSDLPANERTTHAAYQLRWDDRGTPAEDAFPVAPVATYSLVSISLKSTTQGPAYEITGTWKDDDEEVKPFQITDLGQLQISIPCSKQLVTGRKLSIPIKVDIKDAIDHVDFKRVNEVNGVLVLNEGPQLMEVRAGMRKVFSLDDDD